MLASDIRRSFELDKIIGDAGSECLSAFAKTLQDSPDNTIEAFLRSRPPEDRSALTALVAIELRHRFSSGQTCRIEDYLKRFPELTADNESVLDLIYAEFCERRQRDRSAAPQEYYQRFPNFHNSLERLFRIDSLFGQNAEIDLSLAESTTGPGVGDTFLEFRLESELGRGASGRVFLAAQTTLSNRRVVLKITSRRTIEHRTLARLEHPNIVPVLSVHYDDPSGLQAVCMPYQYAAALSDVRSNWSNGQTIPTDGAVFTTAVAHLIPSVLVQESANSNGIAIPDGMDFTHACAWIMHRVAGALHHAHLRGICHRDLKPSNILLTITGQPLLVDFNLSFDETESGGNAAAYFGGTLPYMPPEQIQALHPIGQGRADAVGPRADIYSLAATFFEILTGRLPFELPEPAADRLTALRSHLEKRYAEVPSARALNTRISGDLDALLSKCLDPQPQKRYESAGQLADDLQLFLQDRPLGHVQLPPMHVRSYKFMRRNRRPIGIGAAIGTLIFACCLYLLDMQATAVRERNARDKAEILAVQLQTTAEMEADEALLRLPRDAYKYFLLGFDYFSGRRFLHAFRCFSRCLDLRPDYAPAYYYRARCLANLDKDADALEDFAKAIELDPHFMPSFLHRAICYASSETHADAKLALADLQKVETLMPTGAIASTNLIHLDIARAYSAVSTKLSTIEERDKALVLAEQNLKKALELGLSIRFLEETKKNDRFRMLDPVFKSPNVQRLLDADELLPNPKD